MFFSHSYFFSDTKEFPDQNRCSRIRKPKDIPHRPQRRSIVRCRESQSGCPDKSYHPPEALRMYRLEAYIPNLHSDR